MCYWAVRLASGQGPREMGERALALCARVSHTYVYLYKYVWIGGCLGTTDQMLRGVTEKSDQSIPA